MLGGVVYYLVEHFFGMGGRHTEASSGFCNGCSREAYNYNTNLPLQHGPWERPESRRWTTFWLVTMGFKFTLHTHTHTVKCSKTACIFNFSLVRYNVMINGIEGLHTNPESSRCISIACFFKTFYTLKFPKVVNALGMTICITNQGRD